MPAVSGEIGEGRQGQITQGLTGLDKEFEFHTMSNEKPLEAFQQGNDMI